MKNHTAGRTAAAELCLIACALIWGFTFVFQKTGQSAGAFTFATLRMVIAAIVLCPIVAIRGRRASARARSQEEREALRRNRNAAVRAGMICGIFYFFGNMLQQVGLNWLSAGESGFICDVYTVIVPLLSVLLGKHVPKPAWAGTLLCLGGLYFLCLYEEGWSGFGPGEMITLLSAFSWAAQIIAISHFAPHVDGIFLSFVQAVFTGILGFPLMLLIDQPTLSSILAVWPSLLYVGLMSTAVAYPLQVIGQRGVGPTQASITISLESVFAVIGGALILGERMSAVQYLGCAMMFGANLLAQIPDRSGQKTAAKRRK